MQDSSVDAQSIHDRVLEAWRLCSDWRGADAVIELVVQLVAELESLSCGLTALEAENAALRAKLGTNSTNSSKPPSFRWAGRQASS